MDENESVYLQGEFMPLYEEKIGRIREEFRTTVAGVQSAMLLAIRNYDKKCNDYESLLDQLNVEKSKTQSLEERAEQLEKVIEDRDALILKLQQCRNNCKHSRKFNLSAIGELKKEIAESIKSNDVAKKNIRNFKTKLRSFTSFGKSEREIACNDKTISKFIEETAEEQTEFDKNGLPEQDAFRFKLAQIQSLKFRDYLEQGTHKPQMNVEKSCKDRVKMELEQVIQKNKAVVDELKEVQQRTTSRDDENETVLVRKKYLKMLEDRLKQLEIERQLFPQKILAKLRQMNDHLNGVIDKNRQLFQSVQFLTNERRSLRNEIGILRQLCRDHDEIARKYLHAKKFHQELIHQKNYLTAKLDLYKSTEKTSVAISRVSGDQRERKDLSFKSIALAIVAVERMRTISQKMQIRKD